MLTTLFPSTYARYTMLPALGMVLENLCSWLKSRGYRRTRSSVGCKPHHSSNSVYNNDTFMRCPAVPPSSYELACHEKIDGRRRLHIRSVDRCCATSNNRAS